jgi:hypothetical protein
MRRRLNDKPDSGGGGGYNIPQYTGKKADNTMSNIAAGMGIPAGIALVSSRIGEGDRNAAQREKAADAKRTSDAEMKRESRGIAKPANFDAMQESIQDAKDAKDRAKIKSMGYAKGGKVSSASKRADGCVTKGKTRGKMV